MRRLLSAILSVILILGASTAPTPASAAAKPIKSNFTKMSNLLAAFKAKGVTCSPYTKTPAELVIEEGKCKFQGIEILIDLWPKTSTAKDFADGMKKLAAVQIEFEAWPSGSKVFVFYTNNYVLSMDGVMPDTNKVEKVAKVLQKKLGIKYAVGS